MTVLLNRPVELRGPPLFDPSTGLYAGLTPSGTPPEAVVFDLDTGAERARVPLEYGMDGLRLAAGSVWLGPFYQRLDL